MLKDALNFFMELIEKVKNQKWIIEEMKKEILDLLFPPICAMCGKLDSNWICEKCYKFLSKLKVISCQDNSIKKSYNFDTKDIECEKIDEKVIDIKREQENLEKKEIFFDELFYFFNYKKCVRKLMLQYKFSHKAYISNLFITVILRDEICCRKMLFYDIMIPVPMFKKKKKQRGYNQTELIAEKICKKLNIQLEENCLIKIRNTKVQSTLSGLERKENIKNAFCVNNKNKIKDKKIIVFDDIFTTGETVNEISRVLKQAGAKEILVVVIAKD